MNKEQLQVLGRTSAGKWVKSASVSASGLKCTAELSEILQRQIAGKVHHDLSDFDDHLDDLERCATFEHQERDFKKVADLMFHIRLWNSHFQACAGTGKTQGYSCSDAVPIPSCVCVWRTNYGSRPNVP